MTRYFSTHEQIFSAGEVADVRSWMRECLERWFATGDGGSFDPYSHLFQAHMEAHDALAAIYFSFDASTDLPGNRTEKGLFRDAIADLLLEPVTFEAFPFVYDALLNVGALIKANEVVEALATLAEHRRLKSKVVYRDRFGQESSYNNLRAAIYSVIRGGFESASVDKFLYSTLSSIDEDIDLLPLVFGNLVRRQPNQRFQIVVSFSGKFEAYLFHRLQFSDFDECVKELKTTFNELPTGRPFKNLSAREQRQFAKCDAAWLLESNDVAIGKRTSRRLIKVDSFRIPRQERLTASAPKTVGDTTFGLAHSYFSRTQAEETKRELRSAWQTSV